MSSTENSSPFVLPKVPVAHKHFVSYINKKDGDQVQKLLAPYNAFEAKLREGFAQHPDHPLLQDRNVNAVPIFNQGEDVPRISKRDIDERTHNQTYIMPLSAKERKAEGSPATVQSIAEFKKNFNLFSESSLADLDWSNVVAAGSSVVTALLPTPDKYSTSKKAQREYYHQHLAPSSDVDLFIWGLNERDALKKIEQIEESVRNAILEEVTTVRTKNAITIASHYPIRHVQIVLRLYKSVSEILSGFDVDCSCFAFDGAQVYGTPRGIAAFMTQTNTIDLTRRSPSYESRLSKYAHRGFEVFWSNLDRTKIDPTIFERSFARTVGLARLLVLEKLPKPGDREDYLSQRREERGRPSANTYYRSRRSLRDNVKDQDPNDVPEWAYDDEISNYHSFTVPYGPKYTAKRIEKLLYTKDLLLNAEWNQNKQRTVNLHRHPCFMGPLRSVIHDCCGSCPVPQTNEEQEVAEEESKIYVAGDLEFMKDDPGRQAIGSFHPLTDSDWTDMGYIGNTQELCQRICDGNIAFVEDWCKNNPDSIDRRDHTGRTPLHLAAQSSTPEILRCLVDNGARIVSRLVDGLTALHIASARGSTEMVTILLEKSEENEAAEADKEDRKKAEKQKASQSVRTNSGNESDSDDVTEDMSSDDGTAMTEGSFVKVDDKNRVGEDALDSDDDAEPDFYDINVLAWDTPVSPLHLAILGAHSETIKTLIGTFGADALLPIKIINQYTRNPQYAIMTLLLAARLANPRVACDLLRNGASVAQADLNHISSFHYLVAAKRVNLLKACINEDGPAAERALNHLVITGHHWRPSAESPLTTAIKTGNAELADYLLTIGANSSIDLDSFASAYLASNEQRSYYQRNEDTSKIWREEITQPIFLAVENDMPEIVIRLLAHGNDPDLNILDENAHKDIATHNQNNRYHQRGKSLLDTVISKVRKLDKAIEKKLYLPEPPALLEHGSYLEGSKPNSYARWYISKSVTSAQNIITRWKECRINQIKKEEERAGKQQRLMALQELRARYVDLRDQLKKDGAKTFEELKPNITRPRDDEDSRTSHSKDVPVEMTFQVQFQVSASDKLLDGYLQLFEAAWEGDNHKIKELTLANWGPDGDRKPLHVTTQDKRGFTPFAIAMYRHHFESAKLILGIADAQFKEPEKQTTSRRYQIADDDSEYSGDSENDEDDEGLRLSSQVIDDTYTYDIASLQESVGSSVSAMEMLEKTCEVWWLLDKPEAEARSIAGTGSVNLEGNLRDGLSASRVYEDILSSSTYTRFSFGRFALVNRELGLFRFWLQCCQAALNMKRKNDRITGSFGAHGFRFALEKGFDREIAEMIKIAGAELPLDALIKKTGIENKEKHKYYQGLSIGGQKMTGWARERESNSQRAIGESTPPLLQAATAGSLAAVEWFLSDTPLRYYRDYKNKNKNDPRILRLAEAPGGFEGVVGRWLEQRNNLALHLAVLSKVDSTKTLEVVKYLISVMPDSVDLPSARHKLTPLALAFLNGRIGAARALIDAGADQTTRDASGKNLVHLALINASKSSHTDTKNFKALLAIVDKRLIRSMFIDRCKDGPGALTPLGLWMSTPSTDIYSYSRTTRSHLSPDFLGIMLEFGGEEALTMMDGSGQFPLHLAVKTSHTAMVRKLLEYDPALLFKENAMGQTPLELAHSLYVAECAKTNLSISNPNYRPLDGREPETFTANKRDGDSDDEMDEVSDGERTRTWMVCREFAEKEPRARILVSVNEAREVAKRLAEKKKRQREEDEEKEKEKEEGKQRAGEDEVDKLLGYGALELS